MTTVRALKLDITLQIVNSLKIAIPKNTRTYVIPVMCVAQSLAFTFGNPRKAGRSSANQKNSLFIIKG